MAQRVQRRIRLELRVICTWTWLLPATGIVLALIDVAYSADPPTSQLLALRTMLEVGMPLGGVLLGAPLIEREWIQGTLAQVALRTSLVALLAQRIVLAIGYLVCLTVVAAGVGLVVSPATKAPESASAWQWIAVVILATIAPTLLLMALTQLVTHAAGSAIPGYITGFGAWLGSFVAAQVLPQASQIRDFMLFGWTYPPTPDHTGWMAGKVTMLVCGLLLFLPQVVLLRGEARLIRNITE